MHVEVEVVTPHHVVHTGIRPKLKWAYSEFVEDTRNAVRRVKVSHTADGLQQLLDGMVDAYSRAGLVVDIKKTKILQQGTSPNLAPLVFNIKDCPIANVDEFV